MHDVITHTSIYGVLVFQCVNFNPRNYGHLIHRFLSHFVVWKTNKASLELQSRHALVAQLLEFDLVVYLTDDTAVLGVDDVDVVGVVESKEQNTMFAYMENHRMNEPMNK